MNHQVLSFQLQHQTDQLALTYLEDLWVSRDPKEPRCYTIEFVSFFLTPFLLVPLNCVHLSTLKKIRSSQIGF